MAIEKLVRSSVVGFALAMAATGQRGAASVETVASSAAEIDAILERARPTVREDGWRRIPWRTSLTAALAEAVRDRKPVYAFLSDGWFPTGNC